MADYILREVGKALIVRPTRSCHGMREACADMRRKAARHPRRAGRP